MKYDKVHIFNCNFSEYAIAIFDVISAPEILF